MQKLLSAKNLLATGFFILIIGVFFYPVFIYGYMPFPGDLLMAEYQPWRSMSVDGYNPGSVPNKAQYFDPLRQMYPWRTFAFAAIRNGEFPLWNPHNLSGSPLFANFQSALLYPLNIFYFFFSDQLSWSIQVILQPLCTLITMFLLTRRYKFSLFASLLTSVSYAFSLFMSTFLEYNLIGHYLYLLPLGMLTIEWIGANKKWAYPTLSIVIALLGFAGHLQLFGMTLAYLTLYLILRFIQDKKQKILIAIIFILLGITITSVQLIPGLELIRLSARSAHSSDYFISNLLIRFEQFVLYLIPDLFGNPATRNYLVPFSYPSKALSVGIATFCLAFFSFAIKNKTNYHKSILLLTFVTLLFITLNPFSRIFYKLDIPFISSSSPSNYIFIVSFGLCILGGLGLDYVLKNTSKIKIFYLIVPWGLYFLSLFLIRMGYIPYNLNNLIFSTVLFILLSLIINLIIFIKKTKPFLTVIIILISCAELLYYFHKFNPFVPKTFIYPPTPIISWIQDHAGINRYWGYGSAAIEANFSTQTQTYSPDGYDPLYPKKYGQLIHASKDGKISSVFTDESRSDAVIAPGFGENNMMENPFRLKILSILGVKYILDKTENGSTSNTFPPEIFTKLYTLGDFHVLENKMAVPRIFITNSVDSYLTSDEFTKKFFDPNFDQQKSILILNPPELKVAKALSKQKFTVTNYHANYVEITTSTDAPAFLFLADTNFPGWVAYIDDKIVPIYEANYSFRSVLLPEGDHMVKFLYKPNSILIGLMISFLGIFATTITYLGLNKLNKLRFVIIN